MTGHSHRDRIDAAVAAHRDVQRSLRRQMLERDVEERARARRPADENVVRAGRRILRLANGTDPDPPRVQPATAPRDQRPSRWLT